MKYINIIITIALSLISFNVFAQESSASDADLNYIDTTDQNKPFVIVMAEASAGFYWESSAQAHWGMGALIRFNRSPLPVEIGFRYDQFHTQNDGKFEIFSVPVRIRHDWMFAHASSWDLVYGIDFNYRRDLKQEWGYSLGYSVWIGTGYNFHLTSRVSWGIGVEFGYQYFDSTQLPQTFPMRFHTRFTF